MLSEVEPISMDQPKNNGRSSGRNTKRDSVSLSIGLLLTLHPLSTAAALGLAVPALLYVDRSHKAKMEIISVRERERKLKQKLQMTDDLVRTGVNRFRVTDNRYYKDIK